MIDSLGGPQRVNNVLTTLNLPSISHKNLKVMERRAGDMIEDFANMSMERRGREAFAAEMRDSNLVEDVTLVPPNVQNTQLISTGHEEISENTCSYPEMIDVIAVSQSETRDANLVIDSGEFVIPNSNTQTNTDGNSVEILDRNPFGMTVCADHGWQKRGFDSLTGHTFLMTKRKYGNKVCKTVVKHRTCATCKWWRRNRPGRKPKPHRCVWNHRGSARLMESQAGLEAVREMMEQGTPIKTIEGDGDNTLMARIRSELGVNIKKKLDKNHSVKNIVKKLYDLQKNQKDLKLTNHVVKHLSKTIKYIFAKNQGQPEALQRNLAAFIPHQFGDHSKCEARFCGYKRKPGVKYLHRSLPYKAPLKNPALCEKLVSLFEPIVGNATVYSDLGSSQACEAAHRAATLRAPKHLHYGESESLDYRLKATAACINEGRSYLSETFKEHGLSPGSYTVPYNLKKDMERECRQQKATQLDKKLRRLQLKEERMTSKGACEASEGATYDSEISLGDKDADIHQIPNATPKPTFSKVEGLINTTTSFIIMDLETTDLIRQNVIPHITQIAAVEHDTGSQFSCYVVPKAPMSSGAEDITGIMWDGTNLRLNGKVVAALPIFEALSNFFLWLQKFNNAILIAHNGKKFDFRVLSNAADKCKLFNLYLESCVGCIDSIAVMKSKIPKLPKYSQPYLAEHVCNKNYNAHNALDDVSMLNEILKAAKVSSVDLLKHTYSPGDHLLQENFNMNKLKNLPSLHFLIGQGVVKMTTAENISGSGLNFEHLKLIWKREGEDGLSNVLSAKNSIGKPRVSSDKKLVCSFVQKLSQLFADTSFD
ncbi:uncharacterized protein LOC143059102 isoform X2 [Mytilus galloprovincialis]